MISGRDGIRYPSARIPVPGGEWEPSVEMLLRALAQHVPGNIDQILDALHTVRLLGANRLHSIGWELDSNEIDGTLDLLRRFFSADPTACRIALVALHWLSHETPNQLADLIQQAIGAETPPWVGEIMLNARLVDAHVAVQVQPLLDSLDPDSPRRADFLRWMAFLQREDPAQAECWRHEADRHEERVLGELGEIRVLADRARCVWRKNPREVSETVRRVFLFIESNPDQAIPGDRADIRQAVAYLALLDGRIEIARDHLLAALALDSSARWVEQKLTFCLALLAYSEGDTDTEVAWLRRATSVSGFPHLEVDASSSSSNRRCAVGADGRKRTRSASRWSLG